MSISIKREDLLGLLHQVEPGLSKRDILEQSGSFCFKESRLLSYDDHMACRVPTPFPKDFQAAVPAKPLLSLLGKMTEEVIELELAEGELIVRGKRRKAGIRIEREILLQVDSVEEPTEWRALPEDFADAVKLVAPCAQGDPSYLMRVCIHLAPKWLEACDSYQLTRYRMRTGVKESYLLRQESLSQAVSLGVTEIAETPAWCHFRSTSGLIVSCRRYVEEFPDLAKLLAVEGTQATLPKGLAEAADRAEIFSSENSGDNLLFIDLSPGKLRIRGEGTNGWYDEPRKIVYDGPPLKFLISPKMLRSIILRHNEVRIGQGRLIVEMGRWIYCSCLHVPQDSKMQTVQKEETESTEE